LEARRWKLEVEFFTLLASPFSAVGILRRSPSDLRSLIREKRSNKLCAKNWNKQKVTSGVFSPLEGRCSPVGGQRSKRDKKTKAFRKNK